MMHTQNRGKQKDVNCVEIGGICIIGLGGWMPGNSIHVGLPVHRFFLTNATRISRKARHFHKCHKINILLAEVLHSPSQGTIHSSSNTLLTAYLPNSY